MVISLFFNISSEIFFVEKGPTTPTCTTLILTQTKMGLMEFWQDTISWIKQAVSFASILFCFLKQNEPPHDKTNNVAVRPVKTWISLGICPVCSESSLCTQWVAKDPSFFHADSKDFDQTGWMPRLIWVLAGLGAHAILLVLSWGSSNVVNSFSQTDGTCIKVLNPFCTCLISHQAQVFLCAV